MGRSSYLVLRQIEPTERSERMRALQKVILSSEKQGRLAMQVRKLNVTRLNRKSASGAESRMCCGRVLNPSFGCREYVMNNGL